jgi:hypothetical protein
MSTARDRRLVRLALAAAALLAAATRLLPLLGLIGSLAAVVNARRGNRRRAAIAAAWGSSAALLWIALVDRLDAPNFAYGAPVLAAAVAFAIHRPRARRAAVR